MSKPMTKSDQPNPIACSLNDEQLRERRAMARDALVPHIVSTEREDSGLRLVFPDTEVLRSRVDAFVRLEQACCGFLTFTISPPSEGLRLLIVAPPGAESTLDLLADVVSIE